MLCRVFVFITNTKIRNNTMRSPIILPCYQDVMLISKLRLGNWQWFQKAGVVRYMLDRFIFSFTNRFMALLAIQVGIITMSYRVLTKRGWLLLGTALLSAYTHISSIYRMLPIRYSSLCLDTSEYRQCQVLVDQGKCVL